MIRESISNGSEAQPIERAFVAEQIHDFQHLASLSFRMVQPAK
jgi:hypothetical protein